MEALKPVLDVVWHQDPEAFPFREPVDPNSLGIPVGLIAYLHTALSVPSSLPMSHVGLF